MKLGQSKGNTIFTLFCCYGEMQSDRKQNGCDGHKVALTPQWYMEGSLRF